LGNATSNTSDPIHVILPKEAKARLLQLAFLLAFIEGILMDLLWHFETVML
jgi:hypothetical protein